MLEEAENNTEGDVEDVNEEEDEEGVNDLDNVEDIKVPAFIKKRSENRYKRE